jgi:peptidoglycan/xylan/chitin deacetylase (PgdA/CDA1 family)
MRTRWRRFVRHAEAAWEVPRDLALRRYPPFVTGGALPRGHVPVFCFHSLEPESYARKLEHLARNGYVTLSADEYFAFLSGRLEPPERAVVLTFDDGRSSLRTIGLPLMRRHGLKGIVFVIPGRTLSRPGPLPPTLDDVPSGRTSVAELLAREEGPEAFLSWEEMQDVQASGLIDFASHSLSHARVHVAPRIETFLHPGLRRGYGPLDVPWVRAVGRDLFADEVALGTPLLASEPRLGETPRFLEDPSLRAACVAAVAAEGGEVFFERPDWERRLRLLCGGQRVRGAYEAPAEREAAIRRELREARALIEERLGRPCLDLCYPWHVAGPSARDAARETGYRSAYCGKVAGVPITPAGGDPQRIARIGEDYVELLPGRGRGRLQDVLRVKFARRLAAARA